MNGQCCVLYDEVIYCEVDEVGFLFGMEFCLVFVLWEKEFEWNEDYREQENVDEQLVEVQCQNILFEVGDFDVVVIEEDCYGVD